MTMKNEKNNSNDACGKTLSIGSEIMFLTTLSNIVYEPKLLLTMENNSSIDFFMKKKIKFPGVIKYLHKVNVLGESNSNK